MKKSDAEQRTLVVTSGNAEVPSSSSISTPSFEKPAVLAF